MGKGFPRSLKHADKSTVRVARIDVSETLSVTGSTGVAVDQTAVVGDFPEGNILLLGAVANLTISGPGSNADLSDTWAGDFSLGSTATADATLSGTDVDVIASTALAAATAEVGVATRGAKANAGILLDNTDGSLEVNLNFVVDADDIANAASVDFTAVGQVYYAYCVLGDD
jgi:hypothetical protein